MELFDARIMIRHWSKVIPIPFVGCWLWLGASTRDGYGQIRIDGRTVYAHRVFFEAANGTIPAGLQLDHKCRVRCCVNPAHLEPVTGKENQRRGIHGDLTTHCPAGHEYTDENTRRPQGKRVCVECGRVWQREYARSARAKT